MNLRPIENIMDLHDGTIVTHKGTGNRYVVVCSYGATSVIAVRTVHISNKSEWLIVDSAPARRKSSTAPICANCGVTNTHTHVDDQTKQSVTRCTQCQSIMAISHGTAEDPQIRV